MIVHRFSQEIEDKLRQVGFSRRHEVEISREFLEFMEKHPLPKGHCYQFIFDNGWEFGVTNKGDEPDDAIFAYPHCH